jgi:hypothetical protein
MLIAFNAAPGTIAPEAPNGYGPHAKSLAEMMREGGLSLADLFDRVRLRVNEVTRGAQVPWDSSKVETSFVFFERAADAPPVAAVEQASALRTKSLRDLDAPNAYLAAVERDTLQGYSEFLSAYPDDPMARRVRAIIAARREAITWRRTYSTDTPNAYWSYLGRYPGGAHAADAHRRLADEYLPLPPPDFVALVAPPLPEVVFVLPVPIFVPLPVWCHPPEYVEVPPNNLIFNNIHNTVIINNTTNVVTIRNQNGELVSTVPVVAFALAPLAHVLDASNIRTCPRRGAPTRHPARLGPGWAFLLCSGGSVRGLIRRPSQPTERINSYSYSLSWRRAG